MFTFNAEDNEFAASTGSNVNNGYNGSNTSQLDYPPTSSRDLSITSGSNDDDARLFEVGETYTVQWTGGPSGGAYIENAVVIRSDSFSESSGAIIFEGTDENGDLTQVVWSPGFDLEQWYWDNFDGGNSPGFYTTDQIDGDHRYVCFTEGTPISTPVGAVPIENLAVGDLVHTVDHGLQPILWKTDRRAPGVGKSAPIKIDAGTFGATAQVKLSPDHRLLIRGGTVELLFGSQVAYVPIKALVGQFGISRIEVPLVRYIHLLLPTHAALLANGLHCESLLAGDVALGNLGSGFQKAYKKLQPKLGEQRAAYPCLKVYEGRLLGGATSVRMHA
ncbi:MAG: Hint domain-containing protein [Sulfitobacter sp.]